MRISSFRALTGIAETPAGRDTLKQLLSGKLTVPGVELRQLDRWFTEVYRNPPGTDASGIHGTPEQVKERLEEVIAMGANHLLLNPVSNYGEQLEALAEVVGLK